MKKNCDTTHIDLNEYIIITTNEGLPFLHPIKQIEITKETLEIKDIIDLFVKAYRMNEMDSERLYIVTFNYQAVPKGICLVSVGDNKTTMNCYRTIGEFLLLTGAEKFITIHNHPDCSEEPSADDLIVATRLEQIGNMFDIEFLGSFIINRYKYYNIEKKSSFELEGGDFNEKFRW